MAFYTPYFSEGELFANPGKLIGLDNSGSFSGLQGLSFHGGFLGVVAGGVLFCLIRAKRQLQAAEGEGEGLKKRFAALVANVLDACTLVSPIGIVLVRSFGNFLNGELFGRVIENADDAPGWAMKFPTSPEGQQALLSEAGKAGMTREQAIDAISLPVDPELWSKAAEHVALRHPSQNLSGDLRRPAGADCALGDSLESTNAWDCRRVFRDCLRRRSIPDGILPSA